jgi:hypothetical protein
LPAGALPQRLGLPAKQRDDRGSNVAETGNADAQGRRHGCKAREAGGWETTKSDGRRAFCPIFAVRSRPWILNGISGFLPARIKGWFRKMRHDRRA